MAITPQQARQELARRELARRQTQQEEPIQQQPQQQNTLLRDLLIGTAVMGGGGVIKGIQKFREPFQERKTILQDLMKSQEQLGVEKTQIEYLPKKLSEIQTQINKNYKTKVDKLKYDTNNALNNAKSAVTDFDDKILNTNIGNLSKTIEEGYPQFLKSASKNYEIGMEVIEKILVEKNIQYSTLDFSNFLNKTIKEGTVRGLTPEEISPLIKAQQYVTPKMEGSGLLAEETPMSFQTIKNFRSGINKQYPNSRLSAIVNKNWGEFLETKAPPEIQQVLSVHNKAYSQFAEARFKLSKLVTPAGEFDYKAANRYFLDYAKSKIDDGQQNLGRILGEGNDIVNKIEGAKEAFAKVGDLKTQRVVLKETIPAIKQSQQDALRNLATQAQQQTDNVIKWKSNVNQKLSELAKIQERIENRSLLRIPSKILGLARKAGTAFSMYPMISQAMGIKSFADIQDIAASQVSGIPQEIFPKIRMAREKQKKGEKLTNEDLDLLYEAGLLI